MVIKLCQVFIAVCGLHLPNYYFIFLVTNVPDTENLSVCERESELIHSVVVNIVTGNEK